MKILHKSYCYRLSQSSAQNPLYVLFGMFLLVLHFGDSLFYCLEVCAHTEMSAIAGIVKCMSVGFLFYIGNAILEISWGWLKIKFRNILQCRLTTNLLLLKTKWNDGIKWVGEWLFLVGCLWEELMADPHISASDKTGCSLAVLQPSSTADPHCKRTPAYRSEWEWCFKSLVAILLLITECIAHTIFSAKKLLTSA